MTGPDLVVIGRLGRPHGVTGEVRAQATGSTLSTLPAGTEVLLRPSGGGHAQAATIDDVRAVPRGVLMRLRDVSSRDDAAALTGMEILVGADRLVGPATPDEYFVRDLVGCAVSAGGAPLGTVTDVYAGSANDALVVGTADGGEVLVPFTHDAILDVSLARRTVTVRADLLGDA